MTWKEDPPLDPGDPPPDPGPPPIATVGQKAADFALTLPLGVNMQPEMGWHNGEWCADFVKYCWDNGGADTSDLNGLADSFRAYGDDPKHNTSHKDASYQPQVGDAIVYGDQHVDFVVQRLPDGSVVLEDGNWTNQTHREAPRQMSVGATNDSGQVATDIVTPVPKPGAPAAGIPIAQVNDNGVVSGPDQLPVATADPSTLHAGGGAVVTGSGSVVVGEDQAPLARQGDQTADGGTIVDQSDEHVYSG
jgi:CHAP domain